MSALGVRRSIKKGDDELQGISGSSEVGEIARDSRREQLGRRIIATLAAVEAKEFADPAAIAGDGDRDQAENYWIVVRP
jgi:hypothetical protein